MSYPLLMPRFRMATGISHCLYYPATPARGIRMVIWLTEMGRWLQSVDLMLDRIVIRAGEASG